MKPPKKSAKSPKLKHPRGRPAIRIIEQIDAPPEAIVKAVFRVADQKRDERFVRNSEKEQP